MNIKFKKGLESIYNILFLDRKKQTIISGLYEEVISYNLCFKFLLKRGEFLKKVLLDEEREKIFAEDIWLNYFNRYLFENGTITEKEYKKMTEKISTRKAKLSQKRAVI